MSANIKSLMQFAVDNKASDIHLHVGRQATFRIDGALKSLKSDKLTSAETVSIFKDIAPERNVRELQEVGSTDFAYTFEDKCRFRCAAYKTRGVIDIVLRQIPTTLLSFQDIGLPESFRATLHRPRGLVLVTGPTGSGKTTTLATCIDYLNNNFDHHIVTIEDPIEFYHEPKKSIISQREIGNDVSNYSEALMRALRADPDVLLVGEMRDLETISAALTAAETGHLVFGTLHTTGAVRTVDRIIDAYPADQQEQVRAQLSGSLKAVISQVLCPRVGGGRIAAFEILLSTPAAENLIREAKTFQLLSIIQTSGNSGMITLDDSLWNLWRAEKITREEMRRNAQDVRAIDIRLNQVQKSGELLWDEPANLDAPVKKRK